MRTLRFHILFLAILLMVDHLASAQWSTFAPMPTARWGMNCVEANGKLYAIGGNLSAANEVYNPLSNTWTSLAAAPNTIAYGQIASWNGKIYLMGGAVGSAWQSSNYIYDIATNTWSTGASLLGLRMGGSAVAYNGRIYLACGWNNALLNTLEIYDIATDTWSTGAPAPTARYQTRAGLANGRMYIVGGYTSTWLGLNESYDIASNTWSTHTSMPQGRYLHAGGSDGQNILMATGYAGVATNSFQSYEPATNLWTIQPNIPTARYRVDGAVVNGCFYVAGGFNGSSTLATLEGYCGLSIFPSPSISLFAEKSASGIHLRWELLQTIDAAFLRLESSTDAAAYRTLGSFPLNGSNEYLDANPQGDWISYRLSWKDADGQEYHSNLATVQLDEAASHFFSYAQEQGNLLFIPSIPFPMDQGTARLSDLNGKILKEEQVVEALTWDLSELPKGIYLFQWSQSGEKFVRKILR